jgi:putative endonuclease
VKKPASVWFVYLLECRDGRIYTGITTDLKKRFLRHCSGRGAKFTRANRPSHIIAAKKCRDRSSASKLEWAIKQLRSPRQKRALVADWHLTGGILKVLLGLATAKRVERSRH